MWRHAERREQPLLRERVQALARHARHDDAEQRERGVVVEVLVARLEVQLRVAADEFEDLVDGVHGLRRRPAGERQHRPLAAQAARVVQEVLDRDGRPEVRQLGHVLAHRVLQRELPVLHEQRDGGGGELLRHGTRLEDRLGPVADAVFQVRHAVALRVDDAAPLRDADGAARRAGPVPALEDLVDLHGDRFGRGGRRSLRRPCAAALSGRRAMQRSRPSSPTPDVSTRASLAHRCVTLAERLSPIPQSRLAPGP